MGDLSSVLLFDLDDTLLAFTASMETCWRVVCGEQGPEGVEPDALFVAIRGVADAFWEDPALDDRGRNDLQWARRQIVGRAFMDLGVDDRTRAERLADDYTARREVEVWMFPGAIEVLEALRERGVRMGLLTNGGSVPQRAKVERFGLAQYFETILIEGELGFGKPDPKMFTTALERLDVTPDAAWMIGDHLVKDVGGAQALGIHAIWNDHRGAGLPEGSAVRPDRVIRHVRELLA